MYSSIYGLRGWGDWDAYNEALVRRVMLLFSFDCLYCWDDEARSMNVGMVGVPFKYPHRQVEGIVRALSKRMVELRGRVPDYTTVWGRAIKIPPSMDKTILV